MEDTTISMDEGKREEHSRDSWFHENETYFVRNSDEFDDTSVAFGVDGRKDLAHLRLTHLVRETDKYYDFVDDNTGNFHRLFKGAMEV